MPLISIESVDHFDDILYNREGDNHHDKSHLAIDFNAVWCGPCKRFAPQFEELAETYEKHIHFLSVDVDKVPELAARYKVSALPTFMLLDVVPEPETTSTESDKQPQSTAPDDAPMYAKIEGVNQGLKDHLDNIYKFLTAQAEANTGAGADDQDF